MYPESYAGAEIDHGHPYTVTIHFKGDVPAAAKRIAERVPEVRLVGAAAMSWVESVVTSEDLAAVLRGEPWILESTTDANPITGRVEIEVRPVRALMGTADLMSEADVAALLPPQVRAQITDIVVSDTEILTETASVYGGGSLNSCTAGFTAIRNGVKGVLTAGHCPTQTTYTNHSGGTASLGTKYSHVGTWGDIAFYSTSGTEYDDFYNDWNNLWDVLSVGSYGSLAYNDYVCGFGKTTGKRCGYVYYTSRSHTADGTTASKQVYVWSVESLGGDSGGPWYYGITAWGIHRGVSGTFEVFSYADLADEAVSATVMK